MKIIWKIQLQSLSLNLYYCKARGSSSKVRNIPHREKQNPKNSKFGYQKGIPYKNKRFRMGLTNLTPTYGITIQE